MTALRPDVEEDLYAAFKSHASRYHRLDKSLAALAFLVPWLLSRTVKLPPIALWAIAVGLFATAVYVFLVPSREGKRAERVVDAIRDRPDAVVSIAPYQQRIRVMLDDGLHATMRLPITRAVKMVELLAKRCPGAKVESQAVGDVPVARIVDPK